MKQFGMSEQDLDNMEDRMEEHDGGTGDANPLSMMMNMGLPGQDRTARRERMARTWCPAPAPPSPWGHGWSGEGRRGDPQGAAKREKAPPQVPGHLL